MGVFASRLFLCVRVYFLVFLACVEKPHTFPDVRFRWYRLRHMQRASTRACVVSLFPNSVPTLKGSS